MTSASYVCLLRGINVGGHKLMKMGALRTGFETLKLQDVRTYLQSGNVVFRMQAAQAERVAAKIGVMILRDFGFSVPVLVLSGEEIRAALARNPFLKEKGIDPATMHVTFLSEAPTAAALKMLGTVPAKSDRFSASGRLIYLHCPQGYGNSKLANTVLEKILAVSATTRNWRTVNELAQMLSTLETGG